MDVLVSPAPGSEKVWNLTDRLGRTVGQITHVSKTRFVIIPSDTGSDAPLSQMEAIQPSLNAAMDEVAKRLKGVCQLSGEQGG